MACMGVIGLGLKSDLSRLAEELRLAPERAPRTASWLAEWAGTAAQASANFPDL
jgi:hypothetical protein